MVYDIVPLVREFRLESIGAPVACFVENTFLTFMNHKSVLREQPVWVTRVLGNGRDTAGYKRAFIIREAVTLVLSIPTISFFFLFFFFIVGPCNSCAILLSPVETV